MFPILGTYVTHVFNLIHFIGWAILWLGQNVYRKSATLLDASHINGHVWDSLA